MKKKLLFILLIITLTFLLSSCGWWNNILSIFKNFKDNFGENPQNNTQCIDHKSSEIVNENLINSTCTVNGSYDEVTYCAVCNIELNRETKALPLAEHTPDEIVEENRNESTCTVKGSYDKVTYCAVCNIELNRETRALPLAEHTPDKIVEENRNESTCTVKGSYDEVTYCAVCEIELNRETKLLPLAEHTPAQAVIENEIAATYEEAGSYDSVVYCLKCNAEISRESFQTPKLHRELEYEKRDDGYYVKSIGSIVDAEIIIPDEYNSLPVVGILENAFRNNEFITSITIGNNVKYIGTYSFYGCVNLVDIVFGDSVISIGDYAFAHCINIIIIILPSSLQTIGVHSFDHCDNLQEISGGEGVVSIGAYAFYYCRNLSSINIGSCVVTIGDFAFSFCISLTVITLPDSLETIGNNSFEHCEKLESVSGGEGVTIIGNYAFYYCINLVNVNIGKNVTSIGDYAFAYCINIIIIILPDSLLSIGDHAFEHCEKLESVYGGEGVTVIGDYAFYYCVCLVNINVGNCMLIIGDFAFSFCINLIVIVLPDSLETIGNNAFEHCEKLEEVSGGEGVTIIGKYAFYYCINLVNVNIGKNVISIGDYAFTYCIKIIIIVLPDCLEEIGEHAFDNCTGINQVLGGNGVKYIGNYAFYYCTNLITINIGDSVLVIGDFAFSCCINLVSVIFPSIPGSSEFSPIKIGSQAFSNCYSLIEITIGIGYWDISIDAFDGCDKIFVITNLSYNIVIIPGTEENGYLGKNVVLIYGYVTNSPIYNVNDYLFMSHNGKNYLVGYAGYDREIVLPENYNRQPYEVYKSAFRERIDIVSVTIPATVNKIHENAFTGCTSLENVIFADTCWYVEDEKISNSDITDKKLMADRLVIQDNDTVWNAHRYTNTTFENEVASTCTSTGAYESIVHCCDCLKELSRSNVVTEKLPHTPCDPVKENEIIATDTVAGSYDIVIYCSVCNSELSREHKQTTTEGSSEWIYANSYYDAANQQFVLTQDYKYYVVGAMWYNKPLEDNFSIDLDYYTGVTNRDLGGADGIAIAFFADNAFTLPAGGSLGFDGCKGYGIELDTYSNSSDPSYNHVSLIKGNVSNHIKTAPLSESEDGKWHHLKIAVFDNICYVYVDGNLKISSEITHTGHTWLGIMASTGSGCNLHAVKNIYVENGDFASEESARKHINVELSESKISEDSEYIEYEITATISNTSENLAKNVKIAIELPEEILLDENSEITYSVGDISKENIITVTWKIKIPASYADSVANFKVTTTINNVVSLTHDFVINFEDHANMTI